MKHLVHHTLLTLAALTLLAGCGDSKIGQTVVVNVPGAGGTQTGKTDGTTTTSGTDKNSTSTSTTVQVDDDKVILQTINDNINAINSQDLAALLATLVPNTELYRQFQANAGAFFALNTKQELLSSKVSSKSSENAAVKIERRVSNATGLTTREEVLYTLRKVSSKWLIDGVALQSQQVDSGSSFGDGF